MKYVIVACGHKIACQIEQIAFVVKCILASCDSTALPCAIYTHKYSSCEIGVAHLPYEIDFFLKNSENEDLDPHERKKLKKLKAMSDSEEDDDDDDDRLREELKDLIDDNPIDEEGSDNEDSDDGSGGGPKRRKRSDDEDELDDRLEDDDYDLIEENLGVKVKRTVLAFYYYMLCGFSHWSGFSNDVFFLGILFSLETVQTVEANAGGRQRW